MTDTAPKPLAIEQAVIVDILPTEIWVETDMFGGRHVMLRHQGDEKPFRYASFPYNHRYTSNSGTRSAAESVALAQGAKAPVEHRAQVVEPPQFTGNADLLRLTSVGLPIILRNPHGETQFGKVVDVQIADTPGAEHSLIIEQTPPKMRTTKTEGDCCAR